MRKFKVLDTNILLLDANNLFKFGDNIVVLPETVIDEMDSKKSLDGELGYQARSFGRFIAEASIIGIFKNVFNDVVVKLQLGNTEIHIVSKSSYSIEEDKTYTNDRKIIEIAKTYTADYLSKFTQVPKDLTEGSPFVSNDVMARIRALSLGLAVEEFTAVPAKDYQFTRTIELSSEVFLSIHKDMSSDLVLLDVVPDHTIGTFNYICTCKDSTQVKLCYVSGDRLKLLTDLDQNKLRKQDISPKNLQQLFLARAIQDSTVNIVVCEALAGSGKAQPISEPILTPDGWDTIGNMCVGSEVIGSDGLAKKVVGVFPQGLRDVYEVTFIDGTKVRCDKEHLWSVRCRVKHNYTRFEPTTVEEMISTWIAKEHYDKRYDSYQNVYNYSIQPVSPCEYGIDTPEQTINPYALGLLLGDGCFRNGRVSFTNNDKKIIDSLRNALEPEYTLSEPRYSQGAYNVSIIRGTATKTFINVIEVFGLKGHKSESKFVPKCYMNGTLTTRQAVYKGLTDTDGYVKKGKVLEYSTSSKQLSEDYLELGRSIGKVFTISSRIPKYTHNGELLEGLLNYRIREMANKPKSIISIEKVGEEESQCIMVDSEDHLYVTTGYNLTHNTVSAISNAIRMVRLGQYRSIVYIRHSVNDVPKEEEVGFLSGNDEKMAVYLHPLWDTLDYIVRSGIDTKKYKAKELDEAVAEGLAELVEECNIIGMTGLGLRGRDIKNSIIIVDEVQNASQPSMQKTITRVGEGCKLILIGSNRQIDNPYTTKYTNGLSVLLNACTEPQDIVKMCAVDLHKVLRSPIAEFAEKLFSKDTSKLKDINE